MSDKDQQFAKWFDLLQQAIAAKCLTTGIARSLYEAAHLDGEIVGHRQGVKMVDKSLAPASSGHSVCQVEANC